MPHYSSKQKLKSGVPLGGIGAGKIEILPNGTLDSFTIQNNPDNPLTNLLGFQFGVQAIGLKGKGVAKLLQTVKLAGYETIEEIEYTGSFPYAKLVYHDRHLPVAITLEAVSFFIPQDENNSSLPQATLVFKFTNITREELQLNFMVMARNIVGLWAVGRGNKVYEDKDFTRIIFQGVPSTRPGPADGDFSVSIPACEEYRISYMGGYNLQGGPFIFDKENLVLKAWEYLNQFHNLPNTFLKQKVTSESVELGAALNVHLSLRAGQVKEVPVYFTWFFPNGPEGHAYENRFADSAEVSKFVHENRRFLIKQTLGWQEEIDKSGLPVWLKDGLINNLYPFFSSSFFTKNEKFALIEAPQACYLTGTLDVRFYSSLSSLLFFPRLELKELLLFAAAQREDGYIPHDLGRGRLDLPSNGTTAIFWKDLNPKFILMAYRDFLFTQERSFLDAAYPAAKRAMEWIMRADKNDDYLPDNEGQDQTFDLWPFYGASAYVSSIFLAALLAMEKMAGIMQDEPVVKLCREWFQKASRSFEEKLWNGRYFICYNGKDKNEACTVGQLTGQWYASLLNLGYIASRDKIRRAIESIFYLNGRASKFGAVNSTLPSGRSDKTCLQSQNLWAGTNYAFCALAIYEGYIKEALGLAERVCRNFTDNAFCPWNQPDMYDAKTGGPLFGDHYMRNMVIWALPLGLAQRNRKVKELILSLRNYV